jgi:tetratricopeptide (TPR) repeat protein
MRSRAVLLLVLTVALGVFAYQQATKPPRYTGGPPPRTPYTPPAPVAEPAPAPPVAVGDPPEADMQEIEAAISIRQGPRVEARLRELHAQFPGNARLLTFLARLEYGLATNGRAQSRDLSMISFDPAHMQAADEWATQAVAADPELAGAWIVSARVAQARSQLPKSLEMLARAEALDPDSVTLRLQKGDALLAMATYTGDDVHFPLAIKEYELVLRGPIDTWEESIALRRLGDTWAVIGNDKKAMAYLTRAIDGFEGGDRAFTLEDRARLHLEAGRPDAAIKDSLAALEIMRFDVAAHTLADAHLMKAGLAMKSGNEAAAAPHLKALFAYDPDPTSHVNRMAARATTFPAVYAMFAAPMREQHWDRVVPEALGAAAYFVTAKDLRKINSLGVRFDAGDKATNTLLFNAIAYDNAEAVRKLLALGADTTVKRDDGGRLLDAARIGTQPARKQIRQMLLAKMGRPEGWTDVPVDLPTKGRWYKADRTVGFAESPQDKHFEAGMTLLAGGQCSTPGRAFTCYTFYSAPEKYYGTILIPISRPEDFNALREVEAPTP